VVKVYLAFIITVVLWCKKCRKGMDYWNRFCMSYFSSF